MPAPPQPPNPHVHTSTHELATDVWIYMRDRTVGHLPSSSSLWRSPCCGVILHLHCHSTLMGTPVSYPSIYNTSCCLSTACGMVALRTSRDSQLSVALIAVMNQLFNSQFLILSNQVILSYLRFYQCLVLCTIL